MDADDPGTGIEVKIALQTPDAITIGQDMIIGAL